MRKKRHFQRFLAPCNGSESKAGTTFLLFPSSAEHIPICLAAAEPTGKAPSCCSLSFPAVYLWPPCFFLYCSINAHILILEKHVPLPFLWSFLSPFCISESLHPCVLHSWSLARKPRVCEFPVTTTDVPRKRTLHFGIHKSLVYAGTLSF